MFAGVIEALALGSALAFGLGGGSDVAALVGRLCERPRKQARLERVLELGKECPKQEAEKIREDKFGAADVDTVETQAVKP